MWGLQEVPKQKTGTWEFDVVQYAVLTEFVKMVNIRLWDGWQMVSEMKFIDMCYTMSIMKFKEDK